MRRITPGMAVHCIDNSSRPNWAEWYADSRYCEDMLSLTERYIVRAVIEQDSQFGLDIGIPTPWGDPCWNAERFRPALLREPLSVETSAAQGIEAATAAETVKQGSVHESPVGNADAPKGVGHAQ